MKTNILTLAITLTIGVILAGSLLMPVLNDATDTEDTFTNDGLWRMKEIADGDEWTRTANDDSGYDWAYNDDYIMSVSNGSNALLGEEWCIRSNGQTRGTSLSGNASAITATAGEIVITIVGSGLGGTQEQALPGYGIYNEGSYLMKNGDVDCYVLEDSVLFGTGQTGVDGINFVVNVSGTIKDGVTFTASTLRNGTPISDVVFSDVTVNATEVDGYKGLYKFTSVTANISFTTTVNDETTTHTGAITYNSIVVPYEVTAELAQHLNPGEIAILNALPVLIIVALVVMAAGALYLKRDD